MRLRFDFGKNEWTEVTAMDIPRCDFAHVIQSGRLLVIGGKDEDNTWLRPVESYDPLTDKWEMVAPMLHERTHSAAATSNGFVYVFGGHDGEDFLRSIERYNSQENSWIEVISVVSSQVI